MTNADQGIFVARDEQAKPLRLSKRLAGMLRDPKSHLLAVDDSLGDAYGTPAFPPDHDPVAGLVSTILSQHTSDVNSERAYASLCQRFPTWEALRTAAPELVETTIRSGGLARSKTIRILEALNTLHERRGNLDLSYLSALTMDRARDELLSLHGVGSKTASCVLLFNLGMPAFPVDTHVHRLSRRIGFAPAKASPERVQEVVELYLPPERTLALHINLIRHGRAVCKAQRPLCDGCRLRSLCLVGTSRAEAE